MIEECETLRRAEFDEISCGNSIRDGRLGQSNPFLPYESY